MAVRKINRKGMKGRKTGKWSVPVLRGGDSKAKGDQSFYQKGK